MRHAIAMTMALALFGCGAEQACEDIGGYGDYTGCSHSWRCGEDTYRYSVMIPRGGEALLFCSSTVGGVYSSGSVDIDVTTDPAKGNLCLDFEPGYIALIVSSYDQCGWWGSGLGI